MVPRLLLKGFQEIGAHFDSSSQALCMALEAWHQVAYWSFRMLWRLT